MPGVQDEFSGMLVGWVGESEDGGPREIQNVGSASKVLIAVAVVASIVVTELTILLIALILLLVDPFDDVLVAIM